MKLRFVWIALVAMILAVGPASVTPAQAQVSARINIGPGRGYYQQPYYGRGWHNRPYYYGRPHYGYYAPPPPPRYYRRPYYNGWRGYDHPRYNRYHRRW